MVTDRQPTYTVMARRFRPRSFDEVVGQEHVGQALQNAIRGGRVAHAYLFTGARGVGKTSTARIFAKALNCPNAVDGIACNECEVCQAIAAGSDVDVLEIDGASNRGIDDIRQLRANVGVRSMRSPNKVYIIDEVHMLTKEAFNALLKTLEEPPPNVKFVFCTTEPNKVPDTILSRCQRFDFGTIDQNSIAGRLRQIAEAEGKTVEEDAIELVARRANGSMRDSQSLFDQLLAFGGERVTAEDVHRLLGTASDTRLLELIDACINQQPGRALELMEVAVQQGVQTGGLADQLLAYLRDMMVIAAGAKTVPLQAVTAAGEKQLQEQATRWGLQTISAAMQVIAETKNRLQRTTHGRALLELAIVRLASLEQLDQITALLNGTPVPASSPRPVMPSASRIQPGPAPAPVAPINPPMVQAGSPASEPAQPEVPPPVKKNSDPAPFVSQSAVVAPPSIEVTRDPVASISTQSDDKIRFEPGSVNELWGQLKELVSDALRNHLRNANRTAITGPNRLEISFPRSYAFSKQYLERPEALARVASVIQQLTGVTAECVFSIDQTAEVKIPTPVKVERSRQVERLKTSAVDNDPFVQQAVEIFGAQVGDVRVVLEETLDREETTSIEESISFEQEDVDV